MANAKTSSGEATEVYYEELADLENRFDEVELDIIRTQTLLNAPLYAKRRALISRIPNFWALVLEQAPPEIDQFILPSDSAVLVSALKSIDVIRFEIPPAVSTEMSGSPRSVAIRFEFSPNEWFENEVLEKKFYYRRAKDGWTGLVSDPVMISWKEGKDLSEGITDAAMSAWREEIKAMDRTGKPPAEKLHLQDHLERLADEVTHGSFFSWFAYRGRRLTAEESSEAMKEEEERRARMRRGEWSSPDEAVTSRSQGEEDLEDKETDVVFPAGEELAVAISEDLYPGAIKYFTQAQEAADESDIDLEELDTDEDEKLNKNEPIDTAKMLRDMEGLDDSSDERPKKKRRA